MDLLDANLALFIAASLTLITSPGQDNVYILTRGIAQGRSAALVSAWGVSAGVLVHTAFAALGLSAILASSALAFSVVKWLGAAYLVYLGLGMVLSRGGLAFPEGAPPAASARASCSCRGSPRAPETQRSRFSSLPSCRSSRTPAPPARRA